jgi:DMSO/TMAO reductase YedYZ molybdopterin-dependent catalytic subunit
MDRPMNRRTWLRRTAAIGLAGLLPAGCTHGPEPSPGPPEPFARFPEKVPMRVISDRAPCLETPWRYYREDLTPNEAFYVRWHLEAIPTTVDLLTWRLKVLGRVQSPLELSIDDLRRMEQRSLVAVNQCSGNSRGLFTPPVPGAQWRNGAMGNARWTGVRLRDLLARAGVRAGAVQVVFDGLDEGPLPSVPDYVKALDIDRAREPEVLVAIEMNGAPIPMLNGFPARLVVPGWYATYWIKALTEITVVDRPFEGFWMARAYRIPNNPAAQESPQALAAETVPINRMNVRSFITRPDADASVPAGRPCPLDGLAFDGGDGIRKVEVSTDGGATWAEARLGTDLGRFSFRRWHADWTPPGRGDYTVKARATTNAGEEQPAEPRWNRSGYMRNVIEEIRVRVV